MATLNTDIRYIKGVGEARAKALARLGITDLRSLLSYFPRAYEDRRTYKKIADLVPGEMSCVCAVVAGEAKLSRVRKGLDLVKLRVVDETGALELTYFNQSYLKNTFHTGDTYVFFGRAEGTPRRPQMTNPLFEREGAHQLTGRIMPIYPLTAGVSQSMLYKAVEQGLAACVDELPDILPEDVRLVYQLCHTRFAYENIHFPTDDEALSAARRRLAFEELFLLALGLKLLRERRTFVAGKQCKKVDLSPFFSSLPFSLTGAQRRAIGDIARDLTGQRPMNRLVQGDVGCGKTALAFGAIAMTCACGYQAAMMAPTEILARQHYESAKAMLEPLGIHCGLLIGSMRPKAKREAQEACANGEYQAVFGTHALISEKVAYQKLGLVVTDEQHRFGVMQRSTLQQKGADGTKAPHVLVMSATPIPRTLALILYGDLDVSIVDELPPGRTPVKTRVVPEEKRAGMYGFLRQEVLKGHQAYVVCPLVEDSEMMEDVRSAQATFDALKNGELSGLRVGLTWGAQPADEKAQVLSEFSAGNLDVLVSTTVIEVGVNVPNASVMVIENAERFGLSQLHQLRGRVGRGSAESWCFLLAAENERLRILTQTNDGFIVAQKDLELRGPGDLMGTRQSGEMMADFLLDGDVKLLDEAAKCMKRLRENPKLAAERQQVEAEALRNYRDKLADIAMN
mgnify:CR=1 FL=1